MARLLPDFRTVIDRTAPDRDRSIDVARLGALLVVMFGHCALLLATITADGVQIGNTLGAVPSLEPATWVLQVMPLFFFAGAAAGVHSWRDGTPWGTWLFTRAQRLCRPALWYLGAWTVALIAVRFTMGAESAAALGNEAVALLWFLGTYLIVLAFVPAMARLRSARSAALVIAGLLAVAALGDWARISTHTLAAGAGNLIVVWLIPMVIGAVYAHRFVAAGTALIVAAGTLALQVLAVELGPYDVSLVVTGAERMSNVTPPTLLLALQCIWMPSLFIACAGAVRRWAQRPRVWYLIVVGNSGGHDVVPVAHCGHRDRDVQPARGRPRCLRPCGPLLLAQHRDPGTGLRGGDDGHVPAAVAARAQPVVVVGCAGPGDGTRFDPGRCAGLRCRGGAIADGQVRAGHRVGLDADGALHRCAHRRPDQRRTTAGTPRRRRERLRARAQCALTNVTVGVGAPLTSAGPDADMT